MHAGATATHHLTVRAPPAGAQEFARSIEATAVREIKALISDGVERVNTRSSLVQEAGTAMTEIVVSIGRVNEVMGEIRSSSRGQATGPESVSSCRLRARPGPIRCRNRSPGWRDSEPVSGTLAPEPRWRNW